MVVGAGPAGLAAGAALRVAGVEATLLDRAPDVGASWRGRYDRLRLNTSRHLSRLPGYPFSRSDDRWPSRDQVVRYLERFAAHHALEVAFETEVRRVDRLGARWVVRTTGGDVAGGSVVLATGQDRNPVVPAWPGRESFPGEIVHSGAYRNASPFRDRDVLVVGAGDSAADIAVDLAEGGARSVWMSVRTPSHVIPRSTMGVPTDVTASMIHRLPPRLVDPMIGTVARMRVGDLSRYGMPRPTQGLYSRFLEHRRAPIIDPGDFVRALRSGRVQVVPAVERFDGRAVRLASGRTVEVDAVVAATGYRPGLEQLVGHLGVLAADGYPAVHAPDAHPNAPGLYFLGFRYPFSGNFRQVRIDARKTARRIGRRVGGRS